MFVFFQIFMVEVKCLLQEVVKLVPCRDQIIQVTVNNPQMERECIPLGGSLPLFSDISHMKIWTKGEIFGWNIANFM